MKYWGQIFQSFIHLKIKKKIWKKGGFKLVLKNHIRNRLTLVGHVNNLNDDKPK
jgi:hypothetical protein